jgi:hypothetical protein
LVLSFFVFIPGVSAGEKGAPIYGIRRDDARRCNRITALVGVFLFLLSSFSYLAMPLDAKAVNSSSPRTYRRPLHYTAPQTLHNRDTDGWRTPTQLFSRCISFHAHSFALFFGSRRPHNNNNTTGISLSSYLLSQELLLFPRMDG